MRKILLLVALLSMIVGCQSDKLDNNCSGSGNGGGNCVSPEKPDDLTVFYLGSDFTIDSITGKTFANQDQTFIKYNVAHITYNTQTAEGIIEELKAGINSKLNKNSSITHILGSPAIGGTVANDSTLTVYFDISITETANPNKTLNEIYTFMIRFGEFIPPWNGSEETEPNVSDDDYYLISSAADLFGLSKLPTIDKNIRLTNNINMGNKPFTGLNEFAGIFDGDNQTIRNLNIVNSNDNTPTALIKKIVGNSTIKYLTLDSGKVTGGKYVSAFVGEIYGTELSMLELNIINSSNYLQLFSTSGANGEQSIMGGFIASADNATISITNSISSRKISTGKNQKNNSSGFIAESTNSNLTLDGLINHSDITTGGNIGGIIGYTISTRPMTVNIENTFNTGDLMGFNTYSYVGGIIGNINSTSLNIVNTHNVGNISSYDYTGGIAGSIRNNNALDITTNIESSYNSGAINSSSTGGGIIGNIYNENKPLDISRSYNTGTVVGIIHSGGIIGNNTNTIMIIEETYNKGDILGSSNTSFAGGIIGTNYYTAPIPNKITNSYNAGNINGRNISGGIIGKVYLSQQSNAQTTIEKTFSYGDIDSQDTFKSGAIIGLTERNSTQPSYNSNYWYAPTTNPFANTDINNKEIDADGFKDIFTNFTNWDITGDSSIWLLLDDGIYPTLRNNREVKVQ